jgi:hypothetical protein
MLTRLLMITTTNPIHPPVPARCKVLFEKDGTVCRMTIPVTSLVVRMILPSPILNPYGAGPNHVCRCMHQQSSASYARHHEQRVPNRRQTETRCGLTTYSSRRELSRPMKLLADRRLTSPILSAISPRHPPRPIHQPPSYQQAQLYSSLTMGSVQISLSFFIT